MPDSAFFTFLFAKKLNLGDFFKKAHFNISKYFKCPKKACLHKGVQASRFMNGLIKSLCVFPIWNIFMLWFMFFALSSVWFSSIQHHASTRVARNWETSWHFNTTPHFLKGLNNQCFNSSTLNYPGVPATATGLSGKG